MLLRCHDRLSPPRLAAVVSPQGWADHIKLQVNRAAFADQTTHLTTFFAIAHAKAFYTRGVARRNERKGHSSADSTRALSPEQQPRRILSAASGRAVTPSHEL